MLGSALPTILDTPNALHPVTPAQEPSAGNLGDVALLGAGTLFVGSWDFLAEYGAFNRIVHDIVHEMGGSFSAEHGIGTFKRAELRRYKDPVALELMAQIKATLDPDDLMNPGKVL